MAALRLDIVAPLRSFDLRVALEVGGETVAVVGPSGAGKSTLLRVIAGLAPARGTVEVDGRDWSPLEPERRSVGFVFQDYALFPHLTVRETSRASSSAKVRRGSVKSVWRVAIGALGGASRGGRC